VHEGQPGRRHAQSLSSLGPESVTVCVCRSRVRVTAWTEPDGLSDPRHRHTVAASRQGPTTGQTRKLNRPVRRPRPCRCAVWPGASASVRVGCVWSVGARRGPGASFKFKSPAVPPRPSPVSQWSRSSSPAGAVTVQVARVAVTRVAATVTRRDSCQRSRPDRSHGDGAP
jgi:hypothetical protein